MKMKKRLLIMVLTVVMTSWVLISESDAAIFKIESGLEKLQKSLLKAQ